VSRARQHDDVETFCQSLQVFLPRRNASVNVSYAKQILPNERIHFLCLFRNGLLGNRPMICCQLAVERAFRIRDMPVRDYSPLTLVLNLK
jgi:hypothetical protein